MNIKIEQARTNAFRDRQYLALIPSPATTYNVIPSEMTG